MSAIGGGGGVVVMAVMVVMVMALLPNLSWHGITAPLTLHFGHIGHMRIPGKIGRSTRIVTSNPSITANGSLDVIARLTVYSGRSTVAL